MISRLMTGLSGLLVFSILQAGGLFDILDTQIRINRLPAMPDTVYIFVQNDLDSSIYLMKPAQDSQTVLLPLYSDTLHLIIDSADRLYADTVLSGFSRFPAPQPSPFFINGRGFILNTDPPKSAAELEILTTQEDGTLLSQKYIPAGTQRYNLSSVPDSIKRIYVTLRYVSAVKWGEWSDPLCFDLDSLNKGPVFSDSMLFLPPVCSGHFRIHLPSFTDPENDPVSEIIVDILHSSREFRRETIFGSTDSIFLDDLLSDSTEDNQNWSLSIRLRDSRGRPGPALVSNTFIYDRINTGPSKPVLIKNADRIVKSYPYRISWKASFDSDPDDSVSRYILNITQDPEGFVIYRHFVAAAGDSSIRYSGGPEENRPAWVHIMAVDSHGSWSEADTLRFFTDTVNDAPEEFSFYMVRDTVNAADSVYWTSSWDMNQQDTRLIYQGEVRDFNTGDSLELFSRNIPKSDKGRHGAPVGLLRNHHAYRLSMKVSDERGKYNSGRGERIIHFSDGSNRPPSIPEIITPFYTQELDSSDYIRWKAGSDPDEDSLHYSIEFSESETFIPLIGSVEAGTDTSFRLGRIKDSFQDDSWIFWRVKAVDGWGGESAFSEKADFNFNKEEDAPYWIAERITPADGMVLRDSSLVISWRGLVDNDFSDAPDSLHYEVEFRSDTSAIAPYFYYVHRPTIGVDTGQMQENSVYYYRIRGEDDTGLFSPWSRWHYFYLNLRNEAPTRPEIFLPPSGEILPILGQIGWKASFDPDPFDTLSYIVEFCRDSLFTSHIIHLRTDDHSRLSPYAGTYNRISNWGRTGDVQKNGNLIYYRKGLLYELPNDDSEILIQLNLYPVFHRLRENEGYYFRIYAQDQGRLRSSFSRTGFFRLNTRNEAPDPVSRVVFPADSQVVRSRSPLFMWKNTDDPDPGTHPEDLSYDAQILAGDSVIQEVHTAPGICSWHIRNELDENGEYHFRVRAVDSYGEKSPWSADRIFWINSMREAPRIYESALNFSDTTIFHDSRPLFGWNAITYLDPGPLDRNLAADIEITFPKHDETRTYHINAAPFGRFQDTLSFYDNCWGYFKIRLETADSVFSDWTGPVRFGVDLFPESPLPFSILKPTNDQDTLSTKPLFTWKPSSDPDLNDELHYTIFICEDSLFTKDVIVIDDITDTQYRIDDDNELYDNTRYFWKIRVSDKMGNSAWGSQTDYVPWAFNVGHIENDDGLGRQGSGRASLDPLQPNPFTTKVTISYSLPFYSHCKLEIYNLRGQRSAVLFSEMQSRGDHQFIWNLGSSGYGHLSAGMYVFILTVDQQVLRQKGILIK